jgi:1,4-alpha-glucan branching enzyme
MSFTKKYLKKDFCKVTFKLTAEEAGNAGEAVLLGDFTQWQTNAIPMKKSKRGDFTCDVKLPFETTHQFRYLLDGEKWENDPSADATIGDNSVIVIEKA